LNDCFLVTGSEGCLGSWVVKRLLDRGERCVALDLGADATRLRRLVPDERLAEVAFVRGDIVEDGLIERVIREHEVTRVVHLAALQIPLVAAAPARGAEVNVVGAVRVFEAACAAADQVRGVAYASSAAVFGTSRSLTPATLYGVFKVTNEETARVFADTHGLGAVGLRPWAVFGPGRDQGLTAAPTHALKAVALGVPYRIPFGGRLDLQYAPDVADAFIAASLTKQVGAVVANLRGSVVSVDDYIGIVDEVQPGAGALLTHDDDPIPIPTELGDTALHDVIGDVPHTDLATAVRETVEHFAAQVRLGELRAGELAPT
jgi:UDP-glucuronate 4-epimerase